MTKQANCSLRRARPEGPGTVPIRVGCRSRPRPRHCVCRVSRARRQRAVDIGQMGSLPTGGRLDDLSASRHQRHLDRGGTIHRACTDPRRNLGIGRLSDHRAVRVVSGVIVELFRAIPVLLLIIFMYAVFAEYKIVKLDYLALSAVVVSLTLYNGSVIAEIVRSGINSLPVDKAKPPKLSACANLKSW